VVERFVGGSQARLELPRTRAVWPVDRMGLFRSRFVWSDGKTTRRLNSYDASRNAGSESGQCGSQRERLELISR